MNLNFKRNPFLMKVSKQLNLSYISPTLILHAPSETLLPLRLYSLQSHLLPLHVMTSSSSSLHGCAQLYVWIVFLHVSFCDRHYGSLHELLPMTFLEQETRTTKSIKFIEKSKETIHILSMQWKTCLYTTVYNGPTNDMSSTMNNSHPSYIQFHTTTNTHPSYTQCHTTNHVDFIVLN